jgi:hypothetical protein
MDTGLGLKSGFRVCVQNCFRTCRMAMFVGELVLLLVGCVVVLAQPDPKPIPNRSQTDPNQSQTDPKPIPNRSQTDPKPIPNRSQTDPKPLPQPDPKPIPNQSQTDQLGDLTEADSEHRLLRITEALFLQPTPSNYYSLARCLCLTYMCGLMQRVARVYLSMCSITFQIHACRGQP